MSKLTEIEWTSFYGLLFMLDDKQRSSVREAIDKMLEQRHKAASVAPSASPSGGEAPADAGPKQLHREAKRARRQAAIEALRKAGAHWGLWDPACDAWETLALWLEGLDDE